MAQACVISSSPLPTSTKGATEPFLVRLAMGLHVPCQLAALRARVRAKLTLVWLHARVALLVQRQVAAVLEKFSSKISGL